MPLRHYQSDVRQEVFLFWNRGKRVVMPVLPTGGGKTKIMASTATYKTQGTYGLAVAHRSELVGQISLALAGEGLQHNIIASKATIRTICDAHMEEYGRVLYNPTSDWMVAGVDSLLRRQDIQRIADRVSMAFMDEGHHVVQGNKWGRVLEMFPNAYWMLPTATPSRADGKGLGRHASGYVDALVLGPDMQWMIDNGFLTNFQVRAPKVEDLDLSDVEIGNDGDYKHDQVTQATKRSKKIVGNIVQTYRENTPGKLAIVFAVDLEHAQKITDEFNAQGITAEFISGESPEHVRRDTLRRFKQRKTMVLVNVDLFGEGFDLPAIEVCIMARPTASFGLFVQQWGRALRLDISPVLMAAWDTYTPEQRLAFIAQSVKPVAYIHDHVGNMMHFGGPPTQPVQWSLDDRERKRSSSTNAVGIRVCKNVMCQESYPRELPSCPWCGAEPPMPAAPKGPDEVDGDLHLFTPEMLKELFAKKNQVDGKPLIPSGVSQVVINSVIKNHRERQLAQADLRATMALVLPRNDRIDHRRFFLKFGVDVLTAQTLGAKDASELRNKIIDTLRGME